MSEPDFDKDILSKVMHTYNLDGNFLHVHGKFIEGMLEHVDAPYSNEKLRPNQVHDLRVKIMHTFIKRAYTLGRNDGLSTACIKLKGIITGGYNIER